VFVSLHVPLVEACCDSVQTARASQGFGAGRIELCGPGDGGTTPSLGLIERCLAAVHVPVHVMIRPRAGDFVYDDDEFAVMCADIVSAKSAGVHGVVVGPLHEDGSVHTQQLAELVSLAGGLPVVFHRAFDRTVNPRVALDALLSLHVKYVLTSGHAPTALAGAEQLRVWQAHAGDALTILAGGSVRGENVRSLVTRSGVREVHARATDPLIVRDVVHALRTT